MKVSSKISFFLTVIVSVMLLSATAAYADKHAKKGMNVPKM